MASPHPNQHMLTTVDNPFNPTTQYKEWFTWDQLHGYHTPSLLARVTRLSDEQSDADQALEVERAIDEIVRENVSGMHTKVTIGEV